MGEKQKRPVVVLIVEDEPLVLMNAVELVMRPDLRLFRPKTRTTR